mmetsp:Transcript_27234/g.40212  ORF Transcript_27234/g.40212 Transcript_27234/m.40212 type:complete len:302 (-) Transcript_27234:1048-1953(-)
MKRLPPIINNSSNDNRTSILRSLSVATAFLVTFGSFFVADEVSTTTPQEQLLRRLAVVGGEEAVINLKLYKSDGKKQISRKNKVMFVHIPKSGGDTIEHSKLFEDKPNMIGGHTPISEFVKQEGVENFSSFAIVRHPCERFISAFNFLSQGGINMNDKTWAKENIDDLTLDDWVQKSIATDRVHFQSMWAFLFIEEGDKMVMGVDNIFCQEQFGETVDWITHQFGSIFGEKVPHANKKKHGTCQDLKADTRKIIEEYYALDYCIFGYKPDDVTTNKCEAQSISKQEFTDRYSKCQSSISAM